MTQRIAHVPSGSKIELTVSCRSLKDKDILSKSDPCCVLFIDNNGEWVEFDRTEMIKNNLNPSFAHPFIVEYFFEQGQRLKFALYDVDNVKAEKLSDGDFLGFLECTLGEIVANSPFTKPLLLKGTKLAGKGTITIRAHEVSRLVETLTLQFAALKLEKKDFMSKSDPFLEFHQLLPDGQYQPVHRTEVIKNDLNPKWRPFEIKSSRLCGGDFRAPIRVDCYDYEDRGSHDLIGSFETNVEELKEGLNRELKWPCVNQKKKQKNKKYENSGIIVLTACKVSKDNSFLDFIFGGLQINFTVGVDFTASNGNPFGSMSMHHMSAQQPNHYLRAIRSVGDVIKDYDSDQMFPALGYGAKIPPNMEVSHAFALNFNASNPFCSGVQGILDAYTACVNKVELFGPTNFAPIILHVAQFAAAAQKETVAKNYFVLLIITDGVISDMPETLRAIVYASALPFSIIIVGVGSADFRAMEVLDSDKTILKDDRGNPAKRDIVQFVPFRDYENGSTDTLAKAVLAEVPEQVCQYYKMNNILPSTRPLPTTMN